MQRTLLFLPLALAASFPLLGQDAPVRKMRPMRDAATHDELSKSLRMAQQNDPVRNIGPAIGNVEEDPAKQYGELDLIKDSIILCYRGSLTLLPKRSVLHLPEALKPRFEAVEGAGVQVWADFFKNNRGWIRTLEVTRAQAMGEEPLDEDVVAAFKESAAVVVATFKGGPISVKPYVAPEIAPTQADAAAAKAVETKGNPDIKR